MNRRTILAAIALVILAGGIAFWAFFIRSDAPPPVSLEDAVTEVTETTSATETTVAAVPTEPTLTTVAAAAAGLEGVWSVDPAASFAGYRIQEELANFGTAEAVGRTSDVTGTLSLNGMSIDAVDVEVDMTTLQSDQSRRDGALRDRGLETATFPTATFTLTTPIELGTTPAVGETINATATGDLTLHGVTHTVEIPIEGRLVDEETIVVVGSVDIVVTDFEIVPPTGFSVLSIAEMGTIELQLAFVPA